MKLKFLLIKEADLSNFFWKFVRVNMRQGRKTDSNLFFVLVLRVFFTPHIDVFLFRYEDEPEGEEEEKEKAKAGKTD